jgi:hypothetical protein
MAGGVLAVAVVDGAIRRESPVPLPKGGRRPYPRRFCSGFSWGSPAELMRPMENYAGFHDGVAPSSGMDCLQGR